VNCDALTRWLDDGMPERESDAARAHARGCPRCARSLAAAEAIEALLSSPAPASAPATFTDRVMARVASASEARGHATMPAPSPFPWWARVAADPAAALAAALSAVVVWKADALIALATALAARIAQSLPAAATPVTRIPEVFRQSDVLLGTSIAALPILAWMSWAIYRWSERMVLAPRARGLART
jgi:anti-sigma factor RsiW